MLISLIGTALLIASIERIPRFQLRPQSFLRRFFLTDAFYLLTGFVAGSSLALTYIMLGSEFIGNVFSVPRLSSLSLPAWLLVVLALLALDAGLVCNIPFSHTAHGSDSLRSMNNLLATNPGR